jgi:hypothetical protein
MLKEIKKSTQNIMFSSLLQVHILDQCWGENVGPLGRSLCIILENWKSIDYIWYLAVYPEIWQANLNLTHLDIIQRLYVYCTNIEQNFIP